MDSNFENTGDSISFDVKVDANVLYDFQIFHTYSGVNGIVSTCFGAIGLILFVVSNFTAWIYLILGLVIILYLPFNLRLSSAKLAKLSPMYQKPLHYEINENGITVSQDDVTQTVSWDKCTKAVSTKQSICIYTGKKNASIFPRKQLGDQLPALLALLARYMEPEKVKIRY